MTLRDYQAVDDAEGLQGRVSRVVAAGGARFVNVYRHKDGREIDLHINSSVIRPHGVDYMVVLWDDITESKKAELALRKLRTAVEQSPHAVVITDTEARIEYVNDAFESLTGYSREEVMGHNPRLLSAGKTASEVYQGMWQTLTAGQTWRVLDLPGAYSLLAATPDEAITRDVIAGVRAGESAPVGLVCVVGATTSRSCLGNASL